MITYSGLTAGTVLHAGDTIRVTWRFTLAVVPFLTFDAIRVETAAREALPSLGLIPVSPLESSPGDSVLVVDLKLGPLADGLTAGQLAGRAEHDLPLLAGGAALTVQAVSTVSGGSAQRAADRARARTAGVADIPHVSLGLSGTLSRVTWLAALAVVAVIVWSVRK